jgi:hypothetical protein
MTDPMDAILDALYDTLNGNLSYNGDSWPYKTFGDIEQSYDCVLLSDITIDDDGDEDYRVSDCTVLIDVKEGSKKYGSWKATNTVANQIVQLLAYKDIEFTGFYLIAPITYQSNMITEYLPEGFILCRRLLRFSFKIGENE